MKPKETQPGRPGLLVHQNQNEELSRRKFLQTTIAVGVVVAAAPISGIAQTRQSESIAEPEDPMEKMLSRYGSELGHLTKIG